MQDSLISATLKLHEILKRAKMFNSVLSGTTLSSALFYGDRLFTSNVGDSRIILV